MTRTLALGAPDSHSSNISLTSSVMMSELLHRTIISASVEDRLLVGLIPCVEHLYSCDPAKVLAVALTDSGSEADADGDLMTQTILETFCYQYSIPFMKTDLKVMHRFLKFVPNT